MHSVLLRASSNSLLVLCAGALLRAMKPLRVSYNRRLIHDPHPNTQLPTNYQPIADRSPLFTQYRSVFVPCLPVSLLEYLDKTTPYLMGLRSDVDVPAERLRG